MKHRLGRTLPGLLNNLQGASNRTPFFYYFNLKITILPVCAGRCDNGTLVYRLFLVALTIDKYT
jgi:hypothetical protein